MLFSIFYFVLFFSRLYFFILFQEFKRHWCNFISVNVFLDGPAELYYLVFWLLCFWFLEPCQSKWLMRFAVKKVLKTLNIPLLHVYPSNSSAFSMIVTRTLWFSTLDSSSRFCSMAYFTYQFIPLFIDIIYPLYVYKSSSLLEIALRNPNRTCVMDPHKCTRRFLNRARHRIIIVIK